MKLLQGYGYHVNQDFARAQNDLEFEFAEVYRGSVYGYIAAEKTRFGYQQGQRQKVRTIRQAIEGWPDND